MEGACLVVAEWTTYRQDKQCSTVLMLEKAING